MIYLYYTIAFLLGVGLTLAFFYRIIACKVKKYNEAKADFWVLAEKQKELIKITEEKEKANKKA